MRNEDIAETFNASGAEYESSARELIHFAASQLVERLQLSTGQDFVDLGCGPGTLVAFAEPHLRGGSVIGIDLSRVQLDLARERFRRSELRPRFVNEDAAATSLRDRCADAVGLGLVLPYAERPQQVLKEATRLTRLGGRVAATVIGSPFFGAPGTRFLSQMERRGVAWPEVELQFDPRHAVQLALLCEVDGRRLDDVVIEELEREFWWDDFAAWWRMLRALGLLPRGRERMLETIARDLRQDDRVVDLDVASEVDADGRQRVRCVVKLWLLSATVCEGDPWL